MIVPKQHLFSRSNDGWLGLIKFHGFSPLNWWKLVGSVHFIARVSFRKTSWCPCWCPPCSYVGSYFLDWILSVRAISGGHLGGLEDNSKFHKSSRKIQRSFWMDVPQPAHHLTIFKKNNDSNIVRLFNCSLFEGSVYIYIFVHPTCRSYYPRPWHAISLLQRNC